MQGRGYSADGGLNGRTLVSHSKEPDRGYLGLWPWLMVAGIRGNINDSLGLPLMVTMWPSSPHKIKPKVGRKGTGGKGSFLATPLFFKE